MRILRIGASRLFVLSLAAEHVIAVLAELMVRAVESGRWNADLMPAPAGD